MLLFPMDKARLARESRWHSWIAQPPPKGQVAGSNPARDANVINGLCKKSKRTIQNLILGITTGITKTFIINFNELN
jgi:hypothetical protein